MIGLISNRRNRMDVKIKAYDNTRTFATPTRKQGDAGFDLVATSIEYDSYGNLCAGTNIAMEIPDGYCGLLFPRSSISRTSMRLANSIGLVDSSYRGEIILKFKTDGGYVYEVGDRVGQLIIIPVLDIEFILSSELSETKRGEGGFGSTGK